jgi:hypothetical protein
MDTNSFNSICKIVMYPLTYAKYINFKLACKKHVTISNIYKLSTLPLVFFNYKS